MKTRYVLDGVTCAAEGSPLAVVNHMTQLEREGHEPEQVACSSIDTDELEQLRRLENNQLTLNDAADADGVWLTRYEPIDKKAGGLPAPIMFNERSGARPAGVGLPAPQSTAPAAPAANATAAGPQSSAGSTSISAVGRRMSPVDGVTGLQLPRMF